MSTIPIVLGIHPCFRFPIVGEDDITTSIPVLGSCPATGFALGIERILLVLDKVGSKSSSDTGKLLVCGSDFKEMLRQAADLRSQGFTVEIDVEGRLAGELKEYAEAGGMTIYQVPAGED